MSVCLISARKLCHVEIIVSAFFGEQFSGGALFEDAAFIYYQDAVSLLNGSWKLLSFVSLNDVTAVKNM